MSGAGLILAAPASGSGKTLLTAGLLRCLRERGVRVAAAKAGPDYIDPTFHALASGRPCLNLDVWAMRPATLAGLVAQLERQAELVLCEGVMGLFDGTGIDGEAGSTAELARLTGWPVVLVVDARGQGASAAALVAGFARHDPAVPLAGIIFNRVAGGRHLELLEGALARHVPELPCLGMVISQPALRLPNRHLGLVPAEECPTSEAVLDRAAGAVAAGIDIDRLIALSRPSRLHADPLPTPLPPLGQHIAVARDDAFLFAYEAVLQGWRRQGAALSFFSPLADEPPDPEADAIYLTGGYPELHAGQLAGVERCLAGLRRAAAAGVTVYGECGGYMLLGYSLTDADRAVHRMAELLPLATSFADRRLHLGYRRARLLAHTPLGRRSTAFRGHEFHHAATMHLGDAEPIFAVGHVCGGDLGTTGLRRGSVFGSFIHLIDREDG